MVSTIRTQGYPDELTALCATHSVAIQCNSSDYFDSSSNDANNLYSLLNKVSFYLFSVFSNTNFTELTAGVTRIRTWIVRVQGKHADHHYGPRFYNLSPPFQHHLRKVFDEATAETFRLNWFRKIPPLHCRSLMSHPPPLASAPPSLPF